MAGIAGLGLIQKLRGTNKAYLGNAHYSLLQGGLLDGSIVSSVVTGVTTVVGSVRKKASGSVRVLGGSGVLTDLVTNSGVLRGQTIGTPSSNFAVKVGPGGTPGFYGIVNPTDVSTVVHSGFAVKVG
jgi:hypothetical protein